MVSCWKKHEKRHRQFNMAFKNNNFLFLKSQLKNGESQIVKLKKLTELGDKINSKLKTQTLSSIEKRLLFWDK
jgi:hypothetical protein